jgi:hypothetical protein
MQVFLWPWLGGTRAAYRSFVEFTPCRKPGLVHCSVRSLAELVWLAGIGEPELHRKPHIEAILCADASKTCNVVVFSSLANLRLPNRFWQASFLHGTPPWPAACRGPVSLKP